MTHTEPCPSSASYEPSVWHDEVTAFRIAGEPGHVVTVTTKDSASMEGPEK